MTTTTLAAPDTPVTPFTLSTDQQAALEAFYRFLADPLETAFVLEGFAGCGKSTLVAVLLDRLPNYMKALRLINPQQPDYAVALTATTNKAAENLSRMSGMPVATLHSHLGLLVQPDYRTNITTLRARNQEKQIGQLLVIDEAGMIDRTMLGMVFERTERCKILFIGDPAQLTQPKANGTPVFDAPFPRAALTQVMRQAKGNPIIDTATAFRHVVNGAPWPQFKLDGHHVAHLDRNAFEDRIIAEFTRPDWRYLDSKILAWTNKCVIGYNQAVRNEAHGSPHFAVGDYAICNAFTTAGKKSLKTDQLVEITRISPATDVRGVAGRWFQVDHDLEAFMPDNPADKAARLKQARAEEAWHIVSEIEQSWIDLRAAYAQTINKSQGSTYGTVFIDLDDLKRCHNGNQLARLLYVAVSRAKNHVYFTGDLVA